MVIHISYATLALLSDWKLTKNHLNENNQMPQVNFDGHNSISFQANSLFTKNSLCKVKSCVSLTFL